MSFKFKEASLTNTINWISKMHDHQYRKGTDIPYASHVYGVLNLLMQEGISDQNILKAALLHDVVEDTQISIDQIKIKFGKSIASYVQQLSEDKSKTWEERKLNDIYHVESMPIESKWIKLADKVNNLEMMVFESENIGIEWNKFNRGYRYQQWYYTRIFQELHKENLIKKSDLFQYGTKLLDQIFDNHLTSHPRIQLGDDNDSEQTIYVGEGITSQGYTYTCEFWTIDQLSNFTYYIGEDALNDISKVSVIEFLKNENLVDFLIDEPYVVTRKVKDLNNKVVLSINVIVGDDEDTFSNPKGLVIIKDETILNALSD